MILGKRIKELRDEIKMTQEELGARLNKTKNNISQYETDKRNPDPDTLIKIAKIFDVSLDYLMGATDVRKPYPVPQEELKEFLPKEVAKHTTLQVDKLTDEIRTYVIEKLREKGYL